MWGAGRWPLAAGGKEESGRPHLRRARQRRPPVPRSARSVSPVCAAVIGKRPRLATRAFMKTADVRGKAEHFLQVAVRRGPAPAAPVSISGALLALPYAPGCG